MKSQLIKGLAIICSISLSVSLQSCKKEGCTDEHAVNFDSKAKKDDGTCTYDVSFTISEPAMHSTFYLNDTVHIEVMMESFGEIHGYEVYIRNTSNGNEEVFFEEGESHDNPLHYHGHWIVNVADHSDMELEVRAIVDHDGTYKSETLGFHCMPMMEM